MKAAVLYGPRDIRLETLSVPKLKPNWVLLKVHAAGICGSDLHFYRGETSIPVLSKIGKGKYVPGHEVSGEIYRIGSKVKSLKEGDRVGVEPLVGCGKCRWCRVGWYNLCENFRLIGFYYIGGMAEYLAVPAKNCFKLPEHVSFEEAAMLDCIAVAIHAINKAEVCCEDIVAVLGAGTIGLSTLQASIALGAREVYITGTHDFQLKVAKELGATATFNVRKENFVEKIMELTNGQGVDKVIEAVGGSSNTISDAIEITRKRGIIVNTGIFVKPMQIDLFKFLTKELTLNTAWGYGYWTYRKEFEVSLDLLAEGKISAEKLITHRYPLEKVKDAFETALNRKETKSIKVEIVP